MHALHQLSLALALIAPVAAQPSPGVAQVREARLLRDASKLAEAQARVERALEHDRRNLEALLLQAELARELGDADTAVHSLHLWTDIVDAAKKSPVPRPLRKDTHALLLELDEEAGTWQRLQRSYVAKLLTLGNDYQQRKDLIAALEVYAHVLQIDPNQLAARTAIREIRRTGGREVAVEDVYAGADPTLGKTPGQIEKEDAIHAEWDRAWKKNSENYRYRTDAGYLVLETSAIAMEQMNRFYRTFFRFKEDGGKTPKIEIRIFKNRQEYLDLGASPAEWSGGHFTGDAVETYVGGASGEASIRDMYRTLFHEAAHQFVSLTGGSVPGWLNEAYASFFEGCVILSNGSVKWNQVPAGRLFPLAARMERGWMRDASDGVKDDGGEWSTPDGAPTLRTVITGDYQWGPPWYAPTWGVVYFLYNYRATDGRTVYRDALHHYYDSFKRGRPTDPEAHFDEIVLRGSPLSTAKDLDELNSIWRTWILALRDRYTGKTKHGNQLVRFGDAAVERDELELALEFYQEALADAGDTVDLLEKMAPLWYQTKNTARAAAAFRELKRELELRGETDTDRYRTAARRARELDPLAARYRRAKADLAVQGIALARSYDQRELPTMALEIARRMSANFSIPEALEFYAEVASRTGVSLARWQRAYDEQSLAGWAGGEDSYRAYGSEIIANVDDKTGDGRGMLTRELTCDVTFDADFSLEAKMQIEGDGADGARGALMGLCFGRKGDSDFHAVVLHPKGFMDIVTNRGGEWQTHDHRTMAIGDGWHTLRIDVTGANLDVYFDGFYVRSIEFPNRETMLGSFGLITGQGEARYADIRLLARDSFDPAAAIERELSMSRIASDASLRQPGTFTGISPPAIAAATWLQGEPTTLAALGGHPVMLVFWSPSQDKVIATADYYAHLAQTHAEKLEVIILCDSGTDEPEARRYLEEHPMPATRIAIDDNNRSFESYFVKPGHHGMPRVILIDAAGVVQFEGDPGLRSGVGWKPGLQTYVDDPLARLLAEDG